MNNVSYLYHILLNLLTLSASALTASTAMFNTNYLLQAAPVAGSANTCERERRVMRACKKAINGKGVILSPSRIGEGSIRRGCR